MPYANREDERVYRAKYYKLNTETMKSRSSKHYYDNIDHHKKRLKEYRQTDEGKEVVKNGRANEKFERLKSTEISKAKGVHQTRWDTADDIELVQMKEDKKSWKHIADTLGRSLKGAEARYRKLTQK